MDPHPLSDTSLTQPLLARFADLLDVSHWYAPFWPGNLLCGVFSYPEGAMPLLLFSSPASPSQWGGALKPEWVAHLAGIRSSGPSPDHRAPDPMKLLVNGLALYSRLGGCPPQPRGIGAGCPEKHNLSESQLPLAQGHPISRCGSSTSRCLYGSADCFPHGESSRWPARLPLSECPTHWPCSHRRREMVQAGRRRAVLRLRECGGSRRAGRRRGLGAHSL